MKPIILIKYGGNAMTNEDIKKEVLKNTVRLKDSGYQVVLSHGGGPFIKQILKESGIQSEFIDGQRVTSVEAYKYIEMVLKGHVNADLVKTLNNLGSKAVGLSGADGKTVLAEKRVHKTMIDGQERLIDLGQVGNVAKVDRKLIDILLEENYIPVIACIAADDNGLGYNINGDTFAGTIAGALNVEQFIVLTDVDGIFTDKDKPESIIRELNFDTIASLKDQGIIRGGMVPKTEACMNAINMGAKTARIINGTKPEQILAIGDNKYGTLIKKS